MTITMSKRLSSIRGASLNPKKTFRNPVKGAAMNIANINNIGLFLDENAQIDKMKSIIETLVEYTG